MLGQVVERDTLLLSLVSEDCIGKTVIITIYIMLSLGMADKMNFFVTHEGESRSLE